MSRFDLVEINTVQSAIRTKRDSYSQLFIVIWCLKNQSIYYQKHRAQEAFLETIYLCDQPLTLRLVCQFVEYQTQQFCFY